MIRKFFASLLLMIFLSVSFSMTLGYAFYGVLSDRTVYTGEVLDIFYDFSVDSMTEKMKVKEFESVSDSEMRDLVQKIVPRDDVLYMVDSVIDQYLDGEVDDEGNFSLAIPFDRIIDKSDLFTQEMTSYLFDNLPTCTDAELTGTALRDLECVPENLPRVDFEREVGRVVGNAVFADVPKEYILDFNVGKSIQGNLSESVRGMFGMTFWFAVGISALLLFLTGLVVYKPWSAILKWEGAAIFFYGLEVVAIMFALKSLDVVFDGMEVETEGGIELYQSLYATISERIDLFLAPYAWGAVVLGIVLILAGFFTKRNAESNDPS